MRTLERLGAGDVVAVVSAYRDALRQHQASINRLNVYPVPDGDTGTNMALTVESVAEALADADGNDMVSVADAISLGSLMGARGNSGVILSQILRGIADALRTSDGAGVDGAVVADGLRRAAEGAYQAVETPVEGTILTVVRAAADGAQAAGDVGLVDVLDGARSWAADALARTPDLLPVLRTAGVVDSGGTGLLLLFDAFLHVTAGRDLPPPTADVGGPDPGGGVERADAGGRAEVTAAGQGSRYEVMYLLEAPDESIGSFRGVWAGIGDSIVVVGGDGTYNCHIHTDDIGGAIEAALDAGRPRRIRVSDLWDEIEEERWVRDAVAAPDEIEVEVGCGVVAVCTGEGIRRIFHSLGVNHTVVGGQSMNPSTAEVLAAIDAVQAPEVVVLPNNANVIAVAEAAAGRSDKSVRVVATRTIPEGFAALLDYDPEADADKNSVAMRQAAARVVAGEVTQAVRATEWPGGAIRIGDFIGVSHKGVLSVATTVAEAATGLIDVLIDGAHHEIVTVIAGEGATPADTRRITSWLGEHHPGVSVEELQGGQPLYPYLLGIE